MRYRSSPADVRARTDLPDCAAGAGQRRLPGTALHLNCIDDGADGPAAASAVGTRTARLGDLLGGARAGCGEVGDHLAGHTVTEADEHQRTRPGTAITRVRLSARTAEMRSLRGSPPNGRPLVQPGELRSRQLAENGMGRDCDRHCNSSIHECRRDDESQPKWAIEYADRSSLPPRNRRRSAVRPSHAASRLVQSNLTKGSQSIIGGQIRFASPKTWANRGSDTPRGAKFRSPATASWTRLGSVRQPRTTHDTRSASPLPKERSCKAIQKF